MACLYPFMTPPNLFIHSYPSKSIYSCIPPQNPFIHSRWTTANSLRSECEKGTRGHLHAVGEGGTCMHACVCACAFCLYVYLNLNYLIWYLSTHVGVCLCVVYVCVCTCPCHTLGRISYAGKVEETCASNSDYGAAGSDHDR